MEREVGGGIGMGNTCKPMAVSFKCMTKSTTNKKKKRRRRASLVVQSVKHPPAMQKTWVQSLGQEDPLEGEMATHSGILAWIIPWTEKPGSLYSPWGRRELDTTNIHRH